MSSQRRIDSSRANGAKSRGPVTPEGRARADMAAATHGLTARRVLLESESEADFRTLRDLYLLHFQPRNPFEADLVEQLVAARWRLDRIWSLETVLLEVEIGRREPEIEKEFQTCGHEVRTALAFRGLYDESRVLSGLNRYESRFRRICDRIVKTLEALRANQKTRHEPSPANEHPPANRGLHPVSQGVVCRVGTGGCPPQAVPGLPPSPPSPL